ncbi:PTS transporter subunit EIIC [Lacrimispora sp.]|uniref:PTS transporter subunit EIIC n=1 Tax=Lacrimispora sp. TaxID=2719234 RepID=UPI003994E1F0
MGNYDEMSRYILESIGGSENVTNVTHCATRLRIEVAKKSNVNLEALKTVPNSAGIVDKGRQVQIIIGPKVNDAYNDFLALSGWKPGMNANAEVEDLGANQPHNAKWALDKVAGFMAPVFMPIVPAMIVGGMILALARVGINYFGLDTSTGTVNICMALFQAGFTYFPIYIGYTMAKQLKMPEIYGAFLGAVLVCDRINGVEGLSFLGIPIPQVSYASTVFPVMLGVFFMYYVYKFVKKIMPEMFTFFGTPLLTMIIVIPIELIVLGPLGTYLSNGVAEVCMWLSNTLGFITQPLLAAAYPYMVMFGIDKGITPISIAMIAEQGYDVIFGNMGFVSNIAVGAATLAATTQLKGKESKAMRGLYSSFGITALCGVTEPAFYGALISRPKALMGTACGALAGGLLAGIFGLKKYVQIGCPGLMTFIMYIDDTGSLYYVVIGAIVAVVTIVVSFTSTKILMSRDEKKSR